MDIQIDEGLLAIALRLGNGNASAGIEYALLNVGLGSRKSPRNRAAVWLREALADGPVPVLDLQLAYRQAGFRDGTMRKARDAIRARSFRVPGGWAWGFVGAESDSGSDVTNRGTL